VLQLRNRTEIQLYVTAPGPEGTTQMVPVAGAWREAAERLGLQTPEKNPMSLVIDREKFAVSRFIGRSLPMLISVRLYRWYNRDCQLCLRPHGAKSSVIISGLQQLAFQDQPQ